jgi:NADH-quinone oxidoreductase subunit H
VKDKKPIHYIVVREVVLILIIVLVNVAFITLLERKVLGYAQLRLGPTKPSFVGILQPLADAVKLFSNAALTPYLSNTLFRFIPFLRLTLILVIWPLTPGLRFTNSYSFRIITLLALLRVGVYPVILAGWSSNSKYAELGRIRNIAQTISYEVRLALILAVVILNLRLISLREVTNLTVNFLL